ncbi:uncharacterized protein [Rutidosis leptorrhynchoides]|uniref:uncharacterized protein n=1 Tax=Rutidosis leptorrhynchoides TaxID=125765 RepID=UPI003A98DB4D
MDAIGEHEKYMEDLLKKLNANESEAVSDSFKVIVTVEKFPIHDEKTNWRMKKPIVGEKYLNTKQFKEFLTYYVLKNGFSLWYHRSCEKEVIAKCCQRAPRLKKPTESKKRKYNRYPSVAKGEEPKCSWRCFGRKMKDEASFQVISMVDEHTCVRSFRFGSLINYKWIGREFGDKIRTNPNIMLVDIADLVMKKYKCTATSNQYIKAKTWALTEYEKSIEEHYGLLRSYADELLNSNPGSTIKIRLTQNPDEKLYFDRFYVCLNGLKEGWKNGCRKVIALDGCFLKKPNQGELLTAIGRDGNNHIFPVAGAVVSVENKQNWS